MCLISGVLLGLRGHTCLPRQALWLRALPELPAKTRVSRNMSGPAFDHKHTRRVNSELPNATPMHTNRRGPRRRTTPDNSERRDGVLLQRRARVKGARREKRGTGCDADLSPSPSCQNRLEIKFGRSGLIANMPTPSLLK